MWELLDRAEQAPDARSAPFQQGEPRSEAAEAECCAKRVVSSKHGGERLRLLTATATEAQTGH